MITVSNWQPAVRLAHPQAPYPLQFLTAVFSFYAHSNRPSR